MKSGWIASGRGKLWKSESTYTFIEANKLPQLSDISSDYEWLNDISMDMEDLLDEIDTLDTPDNNINGLVRLKKHALAKGFKFPQSFVDFIDYWEITAQIPSCTGCYLDLSEDLYPVPEMEDTYIMRFMNDSQCCVMWYLLFRPKQEAAVVASNHFFDPEIFDSMNDSEQRIDYQSLTDSLILCADDFITFIHRFWMENWIWYLEYEQLLFTPEQQSYIEQIVQQCESD